MTVRPSLLDLLLELQRLDRVPRTGYLLRGVTECESVTEHSWHLVFLVWALAPRVAGLDTARCLGMALVHDLAEVRTGDLPRTAASYLPAGAKREAEGAALGDLLAPLGEEATALWSEYEASETPEARFVRACDKLQLLLKVAVYGEWGHTGLQEFWEHSENFPGQEFPAVRALFDELLQRRKSAGLRSGDGPGAPSPRS